MIRWYDYIAAYLAAELLFANAKTALLAEVWYINLIASLGVYFIWDLWNDTYIPFRKQQEINRGK